VQSQPAPLYIRNDNAPSDGLVVTYRALTVIGVLALIPLLSSNIEFRPRGWVYGTLFGVGIYAIFVFLHVDTTFKSYGDIRKVCVHVCCGCLCVCLCVCVCVCVCVCSRYDMSLADMCVWLCVCVCVCVCVLGMTCRLRICVYGCVCVFVL
jgi:hypothetical protein